MGAAEDVVARRLLPGGGYVREADAGRRYNCQDELLSMLILPTAHCEAGYVP